MSVLDWLHRDFYFILMAGSLILLLGAGLFRNLSQANRRMRQIEDQTVRIVPPEEALAALAAGLGVRPEQVKVWNRDGLNGVRIMQDGFQ